MGVIEKELGKFLNKFKYDKKIKITNLGLTDRMKLLVVKSLEEDIKKEQKEWYKKIKEKLSDPLPNRLKGKRRLPRSRLFPYMNESKQLYKSVTVDVSSDEINSKEYLIKAKFSFLHEHAYFTHYGYSGKGGQTISDGKWVGWAEDVLTKHGRGGVISAVDIIEEQITKSKLHHLIMMYFKKGI